MLYIFQSMSYLLYGPCADLHGYRVMMFTKLRGAFFERSTQLTGSNLGAIGASIGLKTHSVRVYVPYITAKYSVARKSYLYRKEISKYVPGETTDRIIGWKDLSPATLNLIRAEHAIQDWQEYIKSFVNAWNTFPTLLHRRSLRP